MNVKSAAPAPVVKGVVIWYLALVRIIGAAKNIFSNAVKCFIFRSLCCSLQGPCERYGVIVLRHHQNDGCRCADQDKQGGGGMVRDFGFIGE